MAEETFGAPPGAHQDPNSSTRSIAEPGMPEISCIASEVDDLRPLRMGPISVVIFASTNLMPFVAVGRL